MKLLSMLNPLLASTTSRFERLAALWRSTAARRSLLGVVDQAANSLGSFATVVVLGRCASHHELGLYSLALTPLLLMTNIQAELITAPYTVYRQRRAGAGTDGYNGSVFVHQTFYALLCCCGLALAAWLLSNASANADLGASLGVLALVAPFWLLRAFFRYVSFANLRFPSAVLLDGLAVALQISGLLLFALWSDLNAARAYVVMGGASAVACATWWCARPGVTFRVARDRVVSDWRKNWRFSRWALASQLTGCSTPFVLPWVLAHTSGEAAAGLFAASVNLCGVAMLFVVGVAHSLTPQAARAYADGGVAALTGMLTKTLLFFAVTVGSFWIATLAFGEAIMVAVYGPQFGGTGLAVSLLAAGVLATSFAVAAGNGLWAVERPQANLIADIVTLMVTLIVALVLVGRLGIVGAAVATLCGNAAGATTRLVILRVVLTRLELPPRLQAQGIAS